MGKKWVRAAREAKYAPLGTETSSKKGKRRSKPEYDAQDQYEPDWRDQDRSRYNDR